MTPLSVPEAQGLPRVVGADAPVRPTAPQARRLFPDSPEVPFLQRRCNCAFGDHIFSLLREKIWKKRALDAEIALTREKACRYILRISVTLRVKERPPGDCRIGFPHRTVYYANR